MLGVRLPVIAFACHSPARFCGLRRALAFSDHTAGRCLRARTARTSVTHHMRSQRFVTAYTLYRRSTQHLHINNVTSVTAVTTSRSAGLRCRWRDEGRRQ